MGESSPKRRQENGRVRVLWILRERKARPSQFSCRRQQMANRSPVASSRRSIKRLKPPSQITCEILAYGSLNGALAKACLKIVRVKHALRERRSCSYFPRYCHSSTVHRIRRSVRWHLAQVLWSLCFSRRSYLHHSR